jgi:hypothetical protein
MTTLPLVSKIETSYFIHNVEKDMKMEYKKQRAARHIKVLRYLGIALPLLSKYAQDDKKGILLTGDIRPNKVKGLMSGWVLSDKYYYGDNENSLCKDSDVIALTESGRLVHARSDRTLTGSDVLLASSDQRKGLTLEEAAGCVEKASGGKFSSAVINFYALNAVLERPTATINRANDYLYPAGMQIGDIE